MTKSMLLLALALAGGLSAPAQSNSTPGDTDYAQFSQFIAERNIFDPSRYPHTRTSTNRPRTVIRKRTAGAPYITFVGTMNYEKGLFAFFDSNNQDTKKILVADDEIAGYKLKSITAAAVTLVGPDKKEISMKVGEQLRQDGGAWQLVGQAESSSSPATTDSSTTPSGGDQPAAASETPAVAPSSNLEANDVLKRLMQLREKENQ